MNDIECSSLIQSENENDESGTYGLNAKGIIFGVQAAICVRVCYPPL